jgi:hypothetical protein
MKHIFKIVHEVHSLVKHSLLEGKKSDLQSLYYVRVSASKMNVYGLNDQPSIHGRGAIFLFATIYRSAVLGLP